MSTTSKSPAAVLRVALEVASQAFPAYSHRCSPKKFTQHQLFACLVLKNFLKTDYRGVTGQLQDCSSLQQILGLRHVPHYTTLQKAAITAGSCKSDSMPSPIVNGRKSKR